MVVLSNSWAYASESGKKGIQIYSDTYIMAKRDWRFRCVKRILQN